ncbi:MAG: lipoprotein signal peptidase [Bacteroidales bacterium]|nr:lipoprotein signal peptidase [Bacteroidales bacterium]
MKKPLILILAILFADQFVKIWVKTHMFIGEEIHVFGNWFILHFTENNGMAFGIELAGESGKLILSVFRIIAIILIAFYLSKIIKEKAHRGLLISISLILAGALGNLIDSAFYGLIFSESAYYHPARLFPEGGGYSSFLHGKVVDMLYFPIIKGHYPGWFPFVAGREFIFFRPVFNIADSAITIGVFTLIIFQHRLFPRKSDHRIHPAVGNDNPVNDSITDP